jgi:hypothetical protein
MEFQQLSIWSKEELDFFAPRRKTKKDFLNEKREFFKQKILERVILSDEEKEKYNFPLIKEELINTINYYNQLRENEFINSKKGLMDRINYHIKIFNNGIPQMVFTSLSQYSKKEQKDLLVSDLVIMYKSVINAFSEKKNIDLKKFRKLNNLTFFGYKQHKIMDEYMKSIY